MRSWGNRADTIVVDEPFYAAYLHRTGTHHPGSAEIVSQTETDVHKIIRKLTGPVPGGRSILYQKQMSHHLLPEIDRNWLGAVTNCFLIRDPAEVIASYIKKQPNPSLKDLGFVQLTEIFDWVQARSGRAPAVIDAADLLRNPERVLRLLCRAINVPFTENMLSWPPGFRATDGIWARYWYAEVAQSTSFQPYRSKRGPVPARLNKIYEQCREHYQELYQYRLH
jgi:hypothetical protein